MFSVNVWGIFIFYRHQQLYKNLCLRLYNFCNPPCYLMCTKGCSIYETIMFILTFNVFYLNKKKQCLVSTFITTVKLVKLCSGTLTTVHNMYILLNVNHGTI